MNAATWLVLGAIGLVVVWGYRRGSFDSYLGLAVPHGASTPAGPDTFIVRTPNAGYGPTTMLDHVAETGPATGPTGAAMSPRVTRPGVDPLVFGSSRGAVASSAGTIADIFGRGLLRLS